MATRMANEALVKNLRFRWKDELSTFSDDKLVNMYDEFAMSEYVGDNDERFLEFVKEWFVD